MVGPGTTPTSVATCTTGGSSQRAPTSFANVANSGVGVERIAAVFGLDGGDVHEGDTVVEPEGRVAQTIGLVRLQCGEDVLDEPLVLFCSFGLRPVAHENASVVIVIPSSVHRRHFGIRW